MKKPTKIVEVKDLTKIYALRRRTDKPFTAVDHINFSIGEGEIFGLLGPNGAGKSTTIAMLLGTLIPTSGQITIFGRNFLRERAWCAQSIAFASSYIRLPWRLTVLENLRVYGLLYNLNKKVWRGRVEKLLNLFDVWEQRNKPISELSSGQITRVMLAKAFLPYPKLVLLDEPTASLDPDIAHQVRAFIQEQQHRFQTTILYTSHNMAEVAELCNRIAFLKEGKILAIDTAERLAESVSVQTLEEYFLHISRKKT